LNKLGVGDIMNLKLIAVILAIVAYVFEEIEVDNTILVIVLIAVLLSDVIGLEEALEDFSD